VDCSELTKLIYEAGERIDAYSKTVRAFGYGEKSARDLAISTQKEIRAWSWEKRWLIWELEYREAYERWPKYQNGESLLELDSDGKHREFASLSKGWGMLGIPTPDGLIIPVTAGLSNSIFRFSEKDPVSTDQDFKSFLNSHRVYSGQSVVGSGFRVKQHPKGFTVEDPKTRSVLLNGKTNVGPIKKDSYQSYIKGIIYSWEDNETIYFKLSPEKTVLSLPKQDITKFETCPRGILIEKLYGDSKEKMQIILNGQEVLYDGTKCQWIGHPDGFLLLSADRYDILLNNEKLLYHSEAMIGLIKFSAYPSGVVVHEKIPAGSDGGRRDHWVFYDGSQYEQVDK